MMDVIEQKMRAAIAAHDWPATRVLGDEALIRDVTLEMENSTDTDAIDEFKERVEFLRDRIAAYTTTTSAEVLESLAHHEHNLIRGFVASNTSAPLSALERLARDENTDVRTHVASNSSTPPELLSFLSSDEEWGVRMEVAFNKHTPLETVQQQLVFDEAVKVRAAAALREELPAVMVAMLAYDEAEDVRLEAAEHPNLPVKELVKLMQDNDGYVKEAACLRFETLDPSVVHSAISKYSLLIEPLPVSWYLKLILNGTITSKDFSPKQ